MDISKAERLTVLENQREVIERQLNGMDIKDPNTKLLDVIALHVELEEILYAKIELLTPKKQLL